MALIAEMHILFLSRWFPFPPNNGSKLRIYNILRGLSQSHEISLISFYEPSEGKPDSSELLKYCKQIQYILRKPFQPNSKRALIGFFSSKPRSVIDTISSRMMKLIETDISLNPYDLIIASQFDMAIYAPHFHSVPAIFEEAEVGVIFEKYSHSQSHFLRFRYGLTWRKHRAYLNYLLKNFQACTVVSENEYRLLISAVPDYKKIEIIPNFLDLNDYKIVETPQANHIVFTGSFSYYPNYEAMCWFIREVFPKILEKIPDAHLTITGDPARQSLPPNTHVSHAGFVEDVQPYIARASCSIVPLHTGGGTRLKILEAMALRTPVISTSKGAEGLNVRNGIHMLIADDPEAFANAVIKMLEDHELRRNIIENAYSLLIQLYSSKVIIPHYLDLIENTISSVN